MSIREPSNASKKDLQGYLCYHNTTDTVLNNNEVFVGLREETLGFNSASVSVIASHTGTLAVEQSMNGSDWDYSTTYTFSAATPLFVSVELKARYLHIIITNNSGSNFTFLRGQTILKNTPKHLVEGDDVVRSYRNLSLSVTGQVVQATKCKLDSLIASNSSGSDIYLKVYNKSTAATEADTPVLTVRVPTLSTITYNLKKSLPFTVGLGLRSSGAIADNDTAATSGVSVNLIYSL